MAVIISLTNRAWGQACKTAKAFDRVTKTTIEHEKKVLACYEASYSTFHVLQETHPMGEAVVYSYDFAGRKVQEVRSGPSCKERITTYRYDTQGRLASEHVLLDNDTFIGKNFTYNDLYRLIEAFGTAEEKCTTFWYISKK